MEMRVQEEQERRRKEARTLELLPKGLDELHQQLSECIERYKQAFGPQAADITNLVSKVRITVREEQGGKWQPRARVDVSVNSQPPAFKVERGESEALMIEIGLLSGDRLSFKVGEKFLTADDLTRHILDKALFPKLSE